MAPKRTGFATKLHFRESPFYETLEPLTDTLEMPKIEQHRSALPIRLKLSQENIDRLKGDDSLRIMMYCQAEPPGINSDISFPQQLEIKINDDEVKANFKGLKNKPGSTRPADITGMTRKLSTYINEIKVTYALTTKVDAQVLIFQTFHLTYQRNIDNAYRNTLWW